MSLGSHHWLSAMNVLVRSTSKVVTPMSFLGSYTLCCLSTSVALGTVELMGFEITMIMALGQCVVHPSVRVFTIEALMLRRLSRVIPGFRGTPAGITTESAPLSHFSKPLSSGEAPYTWHLIEMWLKSAATPGALAT
jgi:hypothetical protein